MSIIDAAKATGIPVGTVTVYMSDLVESGQVEIVRPQRGNYPGRAVYAVVGFRTAKLKACSAVAAKPARDPLISSLFGPR